MKTRGPSPLIAVLACGARTPLDHELDHDAATIDSVDSGRDGGRPPRAPEIVRANFTMRDCGGPCCER